MTTKNSNLKSLDQFIDEQYGKRGITKHEIFEAKGLTQEPLANLARTNKFYISKLERNLKDIRFSTLQRIINEGLGGHLDISIRL